MQNKHYFFFRRLGQNPNFYQKLVLEASLIIILIKKDDHLTTLFPTYAGWPQGWPWELAGPQQSFPGQQPLQSELSSKLVSSLVTLFSSCHTGCQWSSLQEIQLWSLFLKNDINFFSRLLPWLSGAQIVKGICFVQSHRLCFFLAWSRESC